MTLTVREIIVRAWRADNLIPIGKSPTAAELVESLGQFQSFIDSLFGNDIGNLLSGWEVPPSPTSSYPSRFPLYPEDPSANYSDAVNVWSNPPANVRLITNAGIGVPVYFPPTPSDGAQMALVNVGADFATTPLTLDGNGRLIEGLPQLVISAALSAPIGWFFRGDLASWVRVTQFTLDSPSPLPTTFDDFLVSAMAVWVSGPNGVSSPPDVMNRAKRGHTLLKTTYAQYQPGVTMPGAFRMQTYQGFGSQNTYWGGGF